MLNVSDCLVFSFVTPICTGRQSAACTLYRAIGVAINSANIYARLNSRHMELTLAFWNLVLHLTTKYKRVLLSQSGQNIRSTSIIAHDFTKGKGKNCNCLPFYICLCIIIAAFIPPPKRDGGDSADFMIKCRTPEKNKRKNKRGGVS